MDGLTATEKIIEKNPEAKIIIVTSHNNMKLYKRYKNCLALQLSY